ncbi:hypothetical protein CTAYLR_000069 [Chrysophaeum taylorii]|uniref:Myosin motor domain-containing protein n=1 Tax=Chrysophaeum taylorii TaxID=2483200 RepID=A0AAD7UHG5_9STRA|nr:hypothetical protein CTAYLR_000069 [Chrysophaeum taylorii]
MEYWVRNPYPLTDGTHWQKRLGSWCGRPEFVPCRVVGKCGDGKKVTVLTVDTPPIRVEARFESLVPASSSSSSTSYLDQLNGPSLLETVRARLAEGEVWSETAPDGPLVFVNPTGPVGGGDVFERRENNPLFDFLVRRETTGGVVCFDGDAGSGKTRLCKMALKWLGRESPALVEACSHAATLRNQNSSRAVVLWRGDGVECFGLELGRVAKQDPNERTFHLLHYLYAGVEGAAERAPSRLAERRNPPRYLEHGMPAKLFFDKEGYRDARRCFGDGSRWDSGVVPTLSAILALGDGSDADAGRLLGIEGLEDAVLTRAPGVPRPDPETARDAIAKTLYSKLTKWILEKLVVVASRRVPVSLLDSAGFDLRPPPQTHSYDDLVRNYCAERCHERYLFDTFLADRAIYESEGLIDSAQQPEDPFVSELLDNRGATTLGVFGWWDEAALVPGETDAHVLESCMRAHAEGPWQAKIGRRRAGTTTTFLVRHSAGEVQYESSGMLRTAPCRADARVLAALARSSRAFVRMLFEEEEEVSAARKKTTGLAAAEEMDALMLRRLGGASSSSSVRHVLCCAPSRPKPPELLLLEDDQRVVFAVDDADLASLSASELPNALFFDPAHVARQLFGRFRLDRLAGFRWRLPRDEFVDRFGFLVDHSSSGDARRLLEALFGASAATRKRCFAGRTLVMMSTQLGSQLEARRTAALAPMEAAATRLAAVARGRRCRRRLSTVARAVARTKGRSARTRLAAGRDIAGAAKAALARHRRHRLAGAARTLVRWARARAAKKQCAATLRAARRLRAVARGLAARRRAAAWAVAASRIASFAKLAGRRFRERRAKLRVATNLGARFRGREARRDPRVREARASRALVAVQATFRAALTTRRYRQLRRAAISVERWWRARRGRALFLGVRAAATRISAASRGTLARLEARRRRVAAMLVLERRELRLAREREAIALAKSNRTFLVDVDLRAAATDDGAWASRFATARWRQVAVGADHTLALSERGELYVWGANDKSRLGRCRTPIKLELAATKRRIATKFLACGAAFSAALSDDGVVFTWGDDRRGQLGRAGVPGKPGAVSIGGRRVASLACGSTFAACVAGGLVFQWGNDTPRPHRVRLAHAATKVACGKDFAMALTLRGAFGWGSNDRGQLGVGDRRPRSDPAEVETRLRLVDIACGSRHTLFLATTHTVLSTGANGSGQLGLGDRRDRETPVRVPFFAAATSKIAAGWRHSVALAANGRVYVWGAATCAAATPEDLRKSVKRDFLRNATPRDRAVLEAAYVEANERRDWTAYCVDTPRLAPLGLRATSIAVASSSTLSATFASARDDRLDVDAVDSPNFQEEEEEEEDPLDELDAPLRRVGRPPRAVPAFLVAADALLREEQPDAPSLLVLEKENPLSAAAGGVETKRIEHRHLTRRASAPSSVPPTNPPPKRPWSLTTPAPAPTPPTRADLTGLFSPHLVLAASHPRRRPPPPPPEEEEEEEEEFIPPPPPGPPPPKKRKDSSDDLAALEQEVRELKLALGIS